MKKPNPKKINKVILGLAIILMVMSVIPQGFTMGDDTGIPESQIEEDISQNEELPEDPEIDLDDEEQPEDQEDGSEDGELPEDPENGSELPNPSEENESEEGTYDPQPTTIEEVQATIDSFFTTWVKPKWASEVSAEIMPPGFRCEYLEDENGMGYWTWFPIPQLMSDFDAQIGTSNYPTLQGAISAAATGDTIIVLRDVTLDGNAVSIDKKITIQSESGSNYKITQTAGRHFTVSGTGAYLTLTDITLEGSNGTVTGATGGVTVSSSGTLDLLNGAVIQNCNGGANGGGIYVFADGSGSGTGGSTLNMKGGIVKNNTATYGAGVYVSSDCTANITDGSVISENKMTVSGSGGGIYLNGSTATINGSAITDNEITASSGRGGGLYITGSSTVTISGSAISNNKITIASSTDTYGYGGGIYAAGTSTVTVNNSSVVKDNTARYGGGLYITGSAGITMENCEVSGNKGIDSLHSEGGGFYLESSGTNTLKNNLIQGNSLRMGEGGGVSVDGAKATFEGNTITGNSASNGAGIYVWNNSAAIINGDVITENVSSIDGGGIFILGGATVTISGAAIEENEAWDGGGIFIANQSNAAITGAAFKNNLAKFFGGGIYIAIGTEEYRAALKTGNTFTDNVTTLEGDDDVYLYGEGTSTDKQYQYIGAYYDNVTVPLLNGASASLSYMVVEETSALTRLVAFCCEFTQYVISGATYKTRLYSMTDEQLAKIGYAIKIGVAGRTPAEVHASDAAKVGAYVTQYFIWNIAEGCYDSEKAATLIENVRNGFNTTYGSTKPELVTEAVRVATEIIDAIKEYETAQKSAVRPSFSYETRQEAESKPYFLNQVYNQATDTYTYTLTLPDGNNALKDFTDIRIITDSPNAAYAINSDKTQITITTSDQLKNGVTIQFSRVYEESMATAYYSPGSQNLVVLDSSYSATINAYVHARLDSGSVTLIKYDEDLSRLKGAQFRLYRADNKYYVKNSSDSSGKAQWIDDKDSPDVLLETDDNGVIVFEGLDFGTYFLEEVTPPDGYALPGTPTHEVTLSEADAAIIIPVQNYAPGSLSVIKVDSDLVGLPGAEFVLYRENENGKKEYYKKNGKVQWVAEEYADKLTTDSSGVMNLTNLLLDVEYTLVEVKAPDGYELPSIYEHPFTLTNEKRNVSLTIKNYKKTGNVLILKLGENDNLERLTGVEFIIYRINDDDKISYFCREQNGNNVENVIWTEVKDNAETLTTDSNGTIRLSGFLEYGTYYLKETKTNDDYQVNEEPTMFEIKDKQWVNLVIFNKEKDHNGSLLIIKEDEEGNRLQGANFILYRELSNGNPVYYAKNEYGDVVWESNILQATTLITLATGEAIATSLTDPATYYLKETKAPDGYEDPDGSEIEFTLKADNPAIAITVTNRRSVGTVEVIKVDEELARLGGAEFILYGEINGETKYYAGYENSGAIWETEDNLNTTRHKVGEDGVLKLTGLGYDVTYYLKEVKPPTGYSLPVNQVYEVKLNQNNRVFTITIKNYSVSSAPESGSILVIKVDEDLKELPGAKFRLYRVKTREGTTTEYKEYYNRSNPDAWVDENDENALESLKMEVDEYGVLRLPDLDFGTYYLEETDAPKGYILPDDNVREFTLTEGNPSQSYVAKNYKLNSDTPDLRVIKIDSGRRPLEGAEFILRRDKDEKGNSGTVYYSLDENDKIVWIADREAAEPLVTGNDGVIEIDQLGYGEYTLIETEPPVGYILPDPAENAFVLTKENPVAGLSITNYASGQLDSGNDSLTVYKRNASGRGLPGAEFIVYRNNESGLSVYYRVGVGGVAEWTWSQSAATTLTTDSNGVMSLDGLDFGTYYLQETKAPSGYRLPAITINEFTLDENNPTYEVRILNYVISTDTGSGGGGGGGSTVNDLRTDDTTNTDTDTNDETDTDDNTDSEENTNSNDNTETTDNTDSEVNGDTEENSPLVIPDNVNVTDIPDDFIGGDEIPLGERNPNNAGLTAIRSTTDSNVYLILDEDGVPLGWITVPEGMDIDDINILEELMPLGSFDIQSKQNPKTGANKYHIPVLLMRLCSMGLFLVYIKRRITMVAA